MHINVASLPLIILNDANIATELLDKKGVTCSDRPELIMAGQLAGFEGWTAALMYGPRLTESRKYIHRTLGTQESLERFYNLFDSEVRKFLKATLRDPDNVQQHIRQCVTI